MPPVNAQSPNAPADTSGQAENLWTGFLHKVHSLKRYHDYGFNELFMLLRDACCCETSRDSGLDMKISDQCAPSLLSYETLTLIVNQCKEDVVNHSFQIVMKELRGVLRKKGRHQMQGYKEREFVIDANGMFRYGPAHTPESKWPKKIKLTDILSVEPKVTLDQRHNFTITKKDGRVLYFTAESDEEKWKWINGFREAIKIAASPLWSPASEVGVNYAREPMFIAMLKLSKFTRTNTWRWRYFYIDDTRVVYYGDPGLGVELGSFQLKAIKRVEVKKQKHGKDRLVLVVLSKEGGKREYWFSHPDGAEMDKFYDRLKLDESPSTTSRLRMW